MKLDHPPRFVIEPKAADDRFYRFLERTWMHRRGHQGWAVDGIAVQGYNIRYLGLVTFGENWHGNHHAFPGLAWSTDKPIRAGG